MTLSEPALTDYPEESALILVCVVPTARDLEIARVLGWYRIPLRKSPKVIQVDYLAFYQTSAFGSEECWQILRFAQVLGNELVTRKDLIRDEPNHPRANEEYYKIQIGPLINLSHPIKAGTWRRVTFFYTTGELFRRAQTLRDLVVRDEERQTLWRSLRERALKAGVYNTNQLPESLFNLDAAILAMLGHIDSQDK